MILKYINSLIYDLLELNQIYKLIPFCYSTVVILWISVGKNEEIHSQKWNINSDSPFRKKESNCELIWFLNCNAENVHTLDETNTLEDALELNKSMVTKWVYNGFILMYDDLNFFSRIDWTLLSRNFSCPPKPQGCPGAHLQDFEGSIAPVAFVVFCNRTSQLISELSTMITLTIPSSL